MLVPIWSRWHVIDHIFTDCTYLVLGFHLVLPCRVRVSPVNRRALANDTLDLFRGKFFLLQIVVLVNQQVFRPYFSTGLSTSDPPFIVLLAAHDLCLGRLFWENFLIGFSSQEQSLYIISHHPHLHRDWLRRAAALLWNSHSLEQ